MIAGDVKLNNRNHIKSLLFRSNGKILFFYVKIYYQKLIIRQSKPRE